MPNPSKLKSPLQALRDAFAPAQDALPTGNLPAVVPPAEPAAGITRRELLGRAASAAARNVLPDVGSVLGGAGSFAEGVAGHALKSSLTPQDYASAYPALFSLAHQTAQLEGYAGTAALEVAQKIMGEATSRASKEALSAHESVFSKLPPRIRKQVWSNVGDGLTENADNVEDYWDNGAKLTGSFIRNFEKHTGESAEQWLGGGQSVNTSPDDVLEWLAGLPEGVPSVPKDPKLFYALTQENKDKFFGMKAQSDDWNRRYQAFQQAWASHPAYLERERERAAAFQTWSNGGEYPVPSDASDRKFFAQMKRELGTPPKTGFSKSDQDEYDRLSMWARAHGFLD